MHAATELAHRMGAADADVWTSWLRAMQERGTNPYGIDIRVLGGAVALHCHAIPSTNFNRIFNVGCADLRLLPELLAFYRERFTPVRLDLNPFLSSESLLRCLPRWGLHPIEFQSNLFMALDDRPLDQPELEVIEVGADTVDEFASMYERAYNYGRSTPPGVVAFREASIRARWDRDDWFIFMVLLDGTPSGGAALHIKDGVATLAGGATLPHCRGRGCQAAVIAHRLNVAKQMGCDLAVSRCAVGSPSQRNLERAGMTTAYTKVIWGPQDFDQIDPPGHPTSVSRGFLRAV